MSPVRDLSVVPPVAARRRAAGSGITLGLDAHPVLYEGSAVLFLTLGVAAEFD